MGLRAIASLVVLHLGRGDEHAADFLYKNLEAHPSAAALAAAEATILDDLGERRRWRTRAWVGGTVAAGRPSWLPVSWRRCAVAPARDYAVWARVDAENLTLRPASGPGLGGGASNRRALAGCRSSRTTRPTSRRRHC